MEPTRFFSTLHQFFPTIFLSAHCNYTSYLTCHIIPHIYAPILLIFHPFLKTKHAALVASRHSKCSGGDVRLFLLSEWSRYRPIRTRSITSNILAWRRNGTETRRRRSCQGEHLRLNTHEKIVLNGDVPRWNGNVTYSVNRPLMYGDPELQCLLVFFSVGNSSEVTVFSSSASRQKVVFTRGLLGCY